MGGYCVLAFCGARYFLSIIDDASRGVWVYLMKNKTKASQLIQNFCHMVHTQFNTKVKVLRSNNGNEFSSGPMKKFYVEHGILHQTSCVDTLQQNGRIERKHRCILVVARALRFEAHLPIEFWRECVLTAVYLINRTPTRLLQGKTPYEMLFKALPSYDHVKVFGCLFYVHNLQRHKDKFEARG